jgi:hypothetical protein
VPLLTQCQTPGCGGSVCTNSRRCTAARSFFGMPGLNSITTGMATPYVLPLNRYMPEPMSLPDLPRVENETFFVSAWPAALVATTVAV